LLFKSLILNKAQ